jgi:hypothetical protein
VKPIFFVNTGFEEETYDCLRIIEEIIRVEGGLLQQVLVVDPFG